MISDFLPPAITVTNARGGGGKPGEAADHRLCLSEEQICNCCRISPGSEAQTQTPAQHSREICGRPSSVGWRWSVFAQSSEHSSDSGRWKLGALQLGRWKLQLGGATFLGRGPPPTHRLHTTQYTLSVWRDQDIKISDTSKVGQGGGRRRRRRVRCGP